MRVELLRLHQQLATTTVYVTHDQTEAMTLAQRIAVLRAGHIVQVGTPREIYDRPKNRFVAGFFGSPEMNFLPGRIEADRFVPQTGEGTLRVLQYPTGPALLGVRAEDLHIETDPSGVGLPVVCELIEDLGADCLVHARHHHRALAFRSTRQHLPLVGSTVTLRCAPERLHLFSAAPTDAPHEALRLLPKD